MTFFFEVDNFTDKIMVVLTTMLVIATLQSTTQQVQRQAKYNCKSHSKLYCRPFSEFTENGILQVDRFLVSILIECFHSDIHVPYIRGLLAWSPECTR